jgi:hypothetical protein
MHGSREKLLCKHIAPFLGPAWIDENPWLEEQERLSEMPLFCFEFVNFPR